MFFFRLSTSPSGILKLWPSKSHQNANLQSRDRLRWMDGWMEGGPGGVFLPCRVEECPPRAKGAHNRATGGPLKGSSTGWMEAANLVSRARWNRTPDPRVIFHRLPQNTSISRPSFRGHGLCALLAFFVRVLRPLTPSVYRNFSLRWTNYQLVSFKSFSRVLVPIKAMGDYQEAEIFNNLS